MADRHTDKPTDKQSNRRTDRQDHREVSLQIKKNIMLATGYQIFVRLVGVRVSVVGSRSGSESCDPELVIIRPDLKS